MRKRETAEYGREDRYEYPFSSVPEDKRKPTLHIVLLLFCCALSTSGIIVGIKVGEALPFRSAVVTCVEGNLILFCVAYFWGKMGQQYGNISAIIIKKILGVQTSVIFSLFVMLMLIGWMGMHGEWMADILTELFPDWKLPHPLTTMLLILIGTLFCLSGQRGLVIVDKVLLPLIILMMLYIVVRVKAGNIPFDVVLQYRPQKKILPISMLSVVLGNYSVSATCMSDVCRFARSRRAVTVGMVLYAVGLIFCNMIGILMVQSLGTKNLTYGVYLLGIMVPGLLCSAMFTATTQIIYVYVSALALQNVLKETMLGGEISQKMATFFIAGFSMIVGIWRLGGYISAYSQFLSFCTLSITGIILVELRMGQGFDKVRWYVPLIAWGFGIVFGMFVWIFRGDMRIFWVAPLSASILYAVIRKRERKMVQQKIRE